MRKLAFSIGLVSILAIGSAFMTVYPKNKVGQLSEVKAEICFAIKNDTGNSVTLHTGTGTTTINNGSMRKLCIKENLKLCIADRGRPGKVLLTISEDISGKTLKLSQLM